MGRCRVGVLGLLCAMVVLSLDGAGLVIAAQADRPSLTAISGSVEWRFSEPQPEWKPTLTLPGLEVAALERTTDALRVTLPEGSRIARQQLVGGVYLDLPGWRREAWADVVVRARTTGSVTEMRVGLHTPEDVLPRVLRSVPHSECSPQRFKRSLWVPAAAASRLAA